MCARRKNPRCRICARSRPRSATTRSLMDPATRRNLELDESLAGTAGPDPRRRIRPHRHRHGRRAAAPLAAPAAARSRRAARALRCGRDADRRRAACARSRDACGAIGDLERILARVALRSARPARPRAAARRARRAAGAAGGARATPERAAAARGCAAKSATTTPSARCCAARSSNRRRIFCATAA